MMNNLNTLTDELLAAKAQQGDDKAMGLLYSRYYMLVFNKCLSFTKNTDEASDLAQDVMLRVIEKITTFNGQSKFSTWLYSITFNYCTDQMRKKKGKHFEDVNLHYEIIDDSEHDLDAALSAEVKEGQAGKALSMISQEDQDLLMMKYQMNKSIQEIQVMLNLSSSAVKMRLKRARAKATDIYESSLTTATFA
ncbi:MAG: RNA polymerase sigma factor [Cytophagales bacterium]|nr:RNA polymerase sigma factor [Cytophagales bacterium]